MAATCKSHIRIHLNEGNDVSSANQVRDALLSGGGITGVHVAVLPTICDSPDQPKIAGINKLNIFQFRDGNLVAWRAYNIGGGKTVVFNSAGTIFSQFVFITYS